MYNDKLHISGFSDEISSDFVTQLQAVRKLDMNYLSLRGIDGRNIGDYSLEEIQEKVLPKLNEYKVAVSSIGSPIGKIFITDDEGFTKQLDLLDRLCQISNLLDCKYIRIFSFYIPKGEEADQYHNKVISQISQFAAIAAKYNVTLLHENEKDIFGDIARRCNEMLVEVNSPYFKAIFDFANFVQCGEDTWNCYQLLKPHIEYIHIKDAVSTSQQNVVCGTGEGKIKTILADLIDKGYEGFLTLEPHLVLFDSLKDLELEAAEDIIKEDKGLTGEEAYALQFHALVDILQSIESEAK
ncbi:sugar phosphate isomerase/epimerase family protein [Paenibacillus endoradicis]|uniref:sugar phosphate isomerase/epimerase family protein n=1 Tax=Paenibacillus endoradicis TaxID=2972487 RepID=UPI002158DCFC|nr:sugar phosphate isomerase/epimerase family protein [Paenibacillus endoradicis]MCR8656402.1 sugar phosphate isomerase/epimerase [Paenibacillus endoradicis]